MKNTRRLIIIGLVTCLLYSALAFIAFYFQSSATTPWGYYFSIVLFLVTVLLVFVYWLAFKKIDFKKDNNIIKIIILFSIVFGSILILIPPIGSADVYNYSYRARVQTVYNENPYIVATESYPDDMFYNFSPKEWNHITMQYGPFWTAISIFFSNLAKDSFFWNIFLYKLLALFSFFGSAYFVWKIVKKILPDKINRSLYLFLWNPLILFESINNAHNDMFMLFIVLVSIYLLLNKRYSLALIVLLFSILIKYITLLIVPIFLYYIIKDISSAKERVKFILKTGILAILITVIFYIPFWEGLEIFKGIFQQSKLLTFFHFSFIPSLGFGLVYMFGDRSYEHMSDIARYSGLVVFVLFYFWQLRNFIKNKSRNFIYYSFLILFAYFMMYLSYLQPWYLIWILPIAVLVDKKYFPQFIFIFTLAGLLSYTIFINSLIYIPIVVFFLFLSFIFKNNYFSEFLNLKPAKSE